MVPPPLPKLQADILTGCVVGAYIGHPSAFERVAFITKPVGLEERGGRDAIISYVRGLVHCILDHLGVGKGCGEKRMRIRIENVRGRPRALRVGISQVYTTDLHVTPPRDAKRDEDVPDELENLP